MDQKLNDVLEAVLLECAQRAPAPLYAAEYADRMRIPRSQLDDALDRLRLGGLVKLTDWLQGRGQGYVLTPQGAEVTSTPRLLDDVRRNGVAAAPVPAPLRAVREPRFSTWDQGEAIRQALLNPRRPLVTVTILLLNLLVFLAGLSLAIARNVPWNRYLGMDNDLQVAEIRHDTGGLIYYDVVARDEWWRLVSYCFVHIGLLHLIVNMYFLYSLGPLMESLWGPVRYLMLYVAAGIGGGCAIVVTKSAGAGASGSLSGLLAAFIVWLAINRRHLPPELASAWMRSLIINLMLLVVISLLPRVSWQGHLGGGIAGAAVALCGARSRFATGYQRWLGWIGMLAAPVVCVGIILLAYPPWDRFKMLWQPELLTSVHGTVQHVQNYLEDADAFFNSKDKVQEALTKIEEADILLRRARRFLNWASPAGGEDLYKDAQASVSGWLNYFERIRDLLEERTKLTADTHRELNELGFELIQITNRVTRALR